MERYKQDLLKQCEEKLNINTPAAVPLAIGPVVPEAKPQEKESPKKPAFQNTLAQEDISVVKKNTKIVFAETAKPQQAV